MGKSGFLAGFEFGTAEREKQGDGFNGGFLRIQFLNRGILQMRFIEFADAGDPRASFFEARDPLLRSGACGVKRPVFGSEFHAGGRVQERVGAFRDDCVVERIVGSQLQVGVIWVEAGLGDEFPGIFGERVAESLNVKGSAVFRVGNTDDAGLLTQLAQEARPFDQQICGVDDPSERESPRLRMRR